MHFDDIYMMIFSFTSVTGATSAPAQSSVKQRLRHTPSPPASVSPQSYLILILGEEYSITVKLLNIFVTSLFGVALCWRPLRTCLTADCMWWPMSCPARRTTHMHDNWACSLLFTLLRWERGLRCLCFNNVLLVTDWSKYSDFRVTQIIQLKYLHQVQPVTRFFHYLFVLMSVMPPISNVTKF